MSELRVNDIVGNWHYLEVKLYPFTEIELEKSYFKNKSITVLGKFIGPACLSMGDYSECYFGKIKAENIKEIKTSFLFLFIFLYYE